MTDALKISLVMATYNGSAYLKEQLDSIRLQSRPVDELLIFDDCSTDNTKELVDQYIQDYACNNWTIKVNEKNKGFGRNFFDGLCEATGDIIFCSDQDDIWELDKIENMSRIIEDDPQIAVLSGGFQTMIDPKMDRLSKIYYFFERFQHRDNGRVQKESFAKKGIFVGNHGWTLAVRRSFLNDIASEYIDDYSHDFFLCSYSNLNDRLYRYNRLTGTFRRHVESTTSYAKPKQESQEVREAKITRNYLQRVTRSIGYVEGHELKDKPEKLAILEKQKAYFEERLALYERGEKAGKIKNLLKYSSYINMVWLIKDAIYKVR